MNIASRFHNVSQFHADELRAQMHAGGSVSGANIFDFVPDPHRAFFRSLPYLFVGTTDAVGWPVATILTAAPGFVHSPDPTRLRIDVLPDLQDPAARHFDIGQELGLLGLDMATRRRNRVNGRISERDAKGFTLTVKQSFHNCLRYIQSRETSAAPERPRHIEALSSLDGEARTMIAQADTFFVASRSRADSGPASGADISHRGGQPGFVLVEGNRLTIPDFRGNRQFNTLGNLLGEPRCSLLFIDFERGDLLQLQGRVDIDWSDRAAGLVVGAQRLWRFHVTRGWRRRNALPLRWSFAAYASTIQQTGTWREAERKAG